VDATRRSLWMLFAILVGCLVPATAFAGALHAELITVGPGSDDLSLYGHSALCVTAEGAPDGRCYDFGVPGGDMDPDRLVWDTVRGTPRFVPVAVERSVLVATFEDMERSLWVQELPLDDRQVADLQASLEAAVASHEPYAYHPYYDNCTTRLRDALDKVTSGKLHDGADAPASGPRFRALSEQGFSGHMFELAGLALFLGTRADRQPTTWERMFLPVDLRDAVTARFGAQPKQLHERREAVIPTSTQAGRVLLVLLGALLAGAIAYGARKSPRAQRLTTGFAGMLLGLLGLTVDVVSLATRIPEFAGNWVTLVLLPMDALLAFAPRRIVSPYLAVRLGMLALMAALSAAGIVAQPLVAVCAFAALPLGASYFFVRKPRGPAATPIARGTTGSSRSPGDAR
jgi:hypothetical protein